MKRYETLDFLRGIAALAVVFFHLQQVRLEDRPVPHGYLAVDFFFILSGFVVALAYERPLSVNLSWASFLWKRVVRLFPLSTLGWGLGLVVLLMKWHSYPDKVDPIGRILAAAAANLFLLPSFFGTAHSHFEFFPGNGPLWTLFFEMGINLVWAWIGYKMPTWWLAAVALVSWIGLAAISLHMHTLNLGFDAATFWGGLARVSFGFPLGVVLYRVRDRFRFPATGWMPALLGAFLLLILCFRWSGAAQSSVWFDLVCILTVFPAIVMAGVCQEKSSRLGRLFGDLSYPVYVLHYPIILLASGLHQSRLKAVNAHAMSAGAVVAAVVLGWVALKWYDEPVRRALSGWMRQRAAAKPVVVAS